MNENTDGPQEWIDPALEARVVAWILGETSAFEAAELERILAENPELTIFKRRIEAVHALAGAAIRPEMPKIQLSPGRRQKLLATIGVRPVLPAGKVFSSSRWWSPHMLRRAAACLVFGLVFVGIVASLLFPAVSASLQRSSKRSVSSAGDSNLFFSSRVEPGQGVVQNGQNISGGSLESSVPVASAKPVNFAMSVAPADADRDLRENVPPPSAPLPPMSVPTAAMLSNGGIVAATAPPSPMPSTAAQPVLMAQAEAQVSEPQESLDRKDSRTVRNRGSSAATGVRAGDAPVEMLEKAEALAEPMSESVQLLAAADQLSALPQEAKADASFKVVEDAAKQIPQQQESAQLMAALQAEEKASDKLAEEAQPLVMKEMESKFVAKAPATRLPAGTEEIRDSDGKFDGFVQYGAPITPAPDMAMAAAELSSDVAAAQGGERAEQVTVTRRFTGRWGKGSGGGGGVAKDKDRAQPTGHTFQETVPTEEPAKLTAASSITDSDSTYMFRGVNVLAPGADSDSNSRELAHAPTVTTTSGEDATVNVGGEFAYATEESAKKKEAVDEKPLGTASASKDDANAGDTAQLLEEAKRFQDSGRYDLALKRYEQTLNVNQYNPAARRGIEQINKEKVKHQEQAYNEVRNKQLLLVDRAWERPVRRFDAGDSRAADKSQVDAGGGVSINRKLDEIIIPQIEVRDASVHDVLEFIKQRASAQDISEKDPARKGVNIVLKPAPDTSDLEAKVTLSLRNISLREALNYIAELTNFKVKVEPYSVVIAPQVEVTNESPAKVLPSVQAEPTFQAEIKTAKQPFSTFSLHVSDVSFQLAKDALAKGAMPDPARIRAEEFYNAFDYNDPSPAPGEEVACRIEQCANPFVQQRDLVRIALKVAAAGRAAGQPLRLTILLDTSGSMEREDRAASVRRALKTLATLLGPNDRVTLIGFARTPRLLAEQVQGSKAGKLVEIAARTPSEGGTNLEQALALASEMALKQFRPAAQNRIVLLTDGAANLGDADPARLARQIEKTRQQGISFDACGVGANGLNDEILEALTRKGDGRYYFINRPEDADAGFARQLAGALRPAAENVKVQVVFNPARVGQYRLIGFEKHLLKKEDFRNDKVQAAELSAEEAGVAVYQVQTLPEGEGELGEVFVRFRDPATGQMVERSWTMPYDAKASAFDQASPSMQLAATAALLAERLRGDSQVDLETMAPVITNLRSKYPHQAKVAELIRMFEKMRQ